MSKIGIVILHWHNAVEVNALLSSIKSWDSSRYRVYLVDNSQDFINLNFEICHLKPAQNIGFSGGCNLGMKKAVEQDCKFILLLNADTNVKEEDVDLLAHQMETNHELAAVSPVLLERKNGIPIFHKGGRNPLRNSNTRIVVEDNDQERMSASYLPGTVLLLRSDVVVDIGMFDERYFFSGEVADWFLRLSLSSWKFDVMDDVVVEHFVSGNESYRKKHYIYYSLRNRYLLINKFGGTETEKLIKNWSRQLRRQMLGAVLRFDFAKFITIYRAVKDGRRGNFGPSKLMTDH